LATKENVKYELQLEALRLMLYGYKLELEAIANRPLDIILPLLTDHPIVHAHANSLVPL
jgi:hypothetical protein